MPRKRPALLTDERRRAILKILRKDGRLSVEDLVGRFNVSAVTLRSDLGHLAEQGHLVRSYGGAILAQESGDDFPISVKQSIHHEEKVRIAQAAAQLIEPRQTVIIDSGSTTAEVARAIKRRGLAALTIITHALNIAQEFIATPQTSVVVIGGLMRHASASLVGPQAEHMLRDLGAHHFFLGIDGLTPDLELTTPDLLEAQINTLMMQIAESTTIVADSSKFGRRSLSAIGNIRQVRRLITDRRASPEVIDKVRAEGVEVLAV